MTNASPADQDRGQGPSTNAESKVPPTVRKWISLVVGLSVGVALGLGPFLGKVAIPGFVPLLRLFPADVQRNAVILSSFAMGLVAVGVHFYADTRVKTSTLKRLFLLTTLMCALFFLGLFVVHQNCTTTVTILGGQEQVTFITGFGERLPSCSNACAAHLSDAECIERLSFAPEIIATCWGSTATKHATTVLLLAYILVTASFGGIVGVLTYKGKKS